MKIKKSRLFGISMALAASVFWGASSVAVQHLVSARGIPVEWLVQWRLIPSGLLILAILLLKGQRIWVVWKKPAHAFHIIFFGFFCVLGLQYTFMKTIESANAIMATLFQFIGPVLMAVYLALRWRKAPAASLWISMAAAFFGIFLVLTNGSLAQVQVSSESVIWGLLVAVAFALYAIHQSYMLQEWSAGLVSGWGMLIGGTLFTVGVLLMSDAGELPVPLTWTDLGLVVSVILLGTLAPFFLFAVSLIHLTPTETGVLSSAEPLVTMLVAVIWLAQPISLVQTVGSMLIIGSSVLLSVRPSERHAHGSASASVGMD